MLELVETPPTYVAEITQHMKVTMQNVQLIILGEVVVSQNGPYRRVRRYIKGKHPQLGELHVGLSKDWETVWEVDVFRPFHSTEVK